jgi:type VI secretion system protein VasG
MNVNLRSLIGKLNHETRGAVEAAAGLCLSRTHYDVEIEHYLMKLLDVTDGDLAHVLKHYGIDRSRLAKELTVSMDRLKSGNARTPSLSPSLVNMLTQGWSLGSVDYGATQIRSGHTLLALALDDDLRRMVGEFSRELMKIVGEDFRKQFDDIVAGSIEDTVGPVAGPTGAPGEARPGGPTPNLDQYTHNLSERAEQGQLDPVLGRDTEIRQMVDILTRRRQNNPILVGEAGVGKTAVVEGFVMRIAQGDVPSVLKNVKVRGLDLALLQAGAGVKGEFENRLKGLIEEVKSSPTPIILFIDEAHTMIGAGGAAGQGDAANLLKPALARGELRTIAATTWSEYKKYFEKDPALARRFQLVKVEEPSEEKCAIMMRGVVPFLEKHHGVRILDDGMHAAVRLAHRYLPDRQLPDKSVSVLDTACARLALGQSAPPAALEGARRRLDDLKVQHRVLTREAAAGADHADRLAGIGEATAETEKRLAQLTEQWEKERDLVDRLRAVRERLETMAMGNGASANGGGGDAEVAETGSAAGDSSSSEVTAASEKGGAEADSDEAAAPTDDPDAADGAEDLGGDPDALRAELDRVSTELAELQGETPLVPRREDGARRAADHSRAGASPGEADHRPGPRAGDHQPPDPDLEGRHRRPQEAHRRVHAGRAQRRREDRDRPGAVRPVVRRRAQPHLHQHVGVPGGSHGLDPEGLTAGLRGLW